ncbi:MAG: HDOD domain-containing protein [Pseudomonadota bacterium]|jgi:HD-like signal output (HDOD) protein
MAQHIDAELERARLSGPLRDILIPPCPELLRQLQQAINEPEPDLVAIDHIASADVAMAAALIRQANSPLYQLVHPVQTVGRAMTVLGLQAGVRLLSGFLLRRALPVHAPLLQHFWETSTRRALACAHIARQLYGLDTGLAYSFGLFCHVGLPVLLQGLRGYGSTLTEALARQDRSFCATENANHRTDHAVVGALVARTWLLPSELALALRLHHDFTCLSDQRFAVTVRQLVAVGLVAEHLVQQHEGAGVSKEWVDHGPQCLQFLELGASEVEHWIDELHPVLQAVDLP